MPKKVDLDALGAHYRAAKDAVTDHLRKQATLELELAAYLKTVRGVPADMLYDPDTGAPTDPQLAQLEAACEQAQTDVAWCEALVVASGEEYKGVPFDVIAASNDAHRSKVAATWAKALGEG